MNVKRLFAVLLICVLSILPLRCAYGGVMVPWENRNVTGEQTVTTIPTALIEPGYHRIVGITVIDIAGLYGFTNSECFVSIEDVVSDGEGGTVAEIIAEAEYTVGGGTEWFFYPLVVTTQIKVHQGAHTDVLLHYAP